MARKRSLTGDEATAQSKRRRSSAETPENEDDDRTHTSATGTSDHVRFGSEEPELDVRSLAQANIEKHSAIPDTEEADDGNSDDDDAPEAIGTADAQAIARAGAVEASRALQADRSKARKERQDRAAHLQAQSENASRKKRVKNAQPDDAEDNEPPKKSARPRIPDLLPDHILADETTGREDSPDQVDERSPPPAILVPNRQVLKFDSKPRDVDVGPVRVRVLEGRNKYMAPKANKTSRNIKEGWLSGRRGKAPVVERHKPNRGFLTS